MGLLAPTPAWAALRVLRDAETEIFLHRAAKPIFQAAGLSPNSVKFILVEDDNINAFVAGGQNIFIYSGLILATDNVDELLGVLAHETAHISGGHLLRMEGAIENASRQSILFMILGLAAAAVSGQGQIGAAATAIGGQATLSNILAHSRAHEDSADQAAFKFLRTAQMPTAGLTSFMGKLVDQELLPASRQDEYMRTHPLSRDRFVAMQRRTESVKDFPRNEKLNNDYMRIRAKLRGYVKPRITIQGESDNSFTDRYGRALALYRLNDTSAAIKMLNELIKEEPNNPYLHEFKGQILFERGESKEAAQSYAAANGHVPGVPLILLGYGRALAADGQLSQAIQILEQTVQLEPDSNEARRALAIAYGRSGNKNRAQLELAEEALLQLDYKEALGRAKSAEFPAGTPQAIRANDIVLLAEQKIAETKEKER